MKTLFIQAKYKNKKKSEGKKHERKNGTRILSQNPNFTCLGEENVINFLPHLSIFFLGKIRVELRIGENKEKKRKSSLRSWVFG